MAKSKAKKLKEAYNDAQVKSGQIATLLSDVQQITDKINFANSEANEKLTSISSAADGANRTLADVQNAVGDIQGIKNEITELKVSVEELIEKSKTLAEEIKAQLGTAAGGSLSHTFEKRKDELKDSKKLLGWLFLLNIIALFGVAIYVFSILQDNKEGLGSLIFLKITLAFPLIYSAFFIHSQYNKIQEFLEEYAFKSAVALSLQAYKELFKDEIDSEKQGEQEKLLDFISSTTRQIYTSPREIIATHPNKEESVELGVLGKLIEMFKKPQG